MPQGWGLVRGEPFARVASDPKPPEPGTRTPSSVTFASRVMLRAMRKRVAVISIAASTSRRSLGV